MAETFGEQVPSLACFNLLADPYTVGLDFLDLPEPLGDSSSCDDSTEWMRELWDAPWEKVGGSSALDSAASSLVDATVFDFDRSSISTSEQQSVNDATSPPADTAASHDQAVYDVAPSCSSDIVTPAAAGPLALQLDCQQVLSAWKAAGGSVREGPASAAPAAAVILHLPAPGISDPALLAGFGSYGPGVAGATDASACSVSGSAPGSPVGLAANSGLPMFVPVAPHRGGLYGGAEAGDAFAGGALVRGPSGMVPVACSSNAAFVPGTVPAAITTIPAKSADAKTARAACALRCKQKKCSRQSTKIRYEMRKINAEQRPRYKGRFVKRDSMLGLDSFESDMVGLTSNLSAASSLSDAQWLF